MGIALWRAAVLVFCSNYIRRVSPSLDISLSNATRQKNSSAALQFSRMPRGIIPLTRLLQKLRYRISIFPALARTFFPMPRKTNKIALVLTFGLSSLCWRQDDPKREIFSDERGESRARRINKRAVDKKRARISVRERNNYWDEPGREFTK